MSCFLCIIAIAACMEELNLRGSLPRLLAYATLVLASGAIAVFGIVRYQQIVSEAERLGEHATCRSCGAYARFRMISASRVRCRKCANEWRSID